VLHNLCLRQGKGRAKFLEKGAAMDLRLFSLPPAWGLPTWHPDCLKVQAYMRLCGVKFESDQSTAAAMASYGQAPHKVYTTGQVAWLECAFVRGVSMCRALQLLVASFPVAKHMTLGTTS